MKQLLPSLGVPKLIPFRMKKEKLAQSLAELIEDVNEVINLAQTKSEFAQLETISITAQVSVEGGIDWIGQATAGYTNAMMLTFKVRQS
jgi:hypothetical protein